MQEQEELLKFIYRLSKGDYNTFLASTKGFGESLGLSQAQVNIALKELAKRGLVKSILFGGVQITHLGVHEVENNLLSSTEIQQVGQTFSSKPESLFDNSLKRQANQQKILFLASNPIDTDRLRLGKELQEIEESLERSKERDKFDLTAKHAVTLEVLFRSLLKENPNIIHFSGHGDCDGLALENENGSKYLVDGETLANLFKEFDHIECVVLNACFSNSQAEAIARHIPYIIGMSKEIDDKVAIKFSARFYDALGNGESIKKSYYLAVSALSYTPLTVTRDILEHPEFSPELRRQKQTPVLVIGNQKNIPSKAARKNHYHGIAHHIDWIRIAEDETAHLLTFQMECMDEEERSQGDISVELIKNSGLQIMIEDGSRLEVSGKFGDDGILKAGSIKNLDTGVSIRGDRTVRQKTRSRIWKSGPFILLASFFSISFVSVSSYLTETNIFNFFPEESSSRTPNPAPTSTETTPIPTPTPTETTPTPTPTPAETTPTPTPTPAKTTPTPTPTPTRTTPPPTPAPDPGRLAELRTRENILTREISDLQGKLRTAEEEKAQLQNSLSTRDESLSNAEEFQNGIAADLAVERETLERITQLHEQGAISSGQLEQQQQEVKRLESELSQNGIAVEALQQQRDEVQSDLDSKTARIDELKREISRKQEEREDVRAEIRRLSSSN